MAKQNSVQLTGHIGREAELRSDTVTSTSLALNERWTDRDGKPQEHTNWFRLVGFGEAHPLRSVATGDYVSIQGKLRSSEYTDKDGVKRTGVEIIVFGLEHVTDQRPAPGADGSTGAEGVEELDDIPF